MTELKFDKGKHEYKVGNRKLTPVTVFVKQFFSKFDEKKISKLVAKARRRKGEKNSKGKPINAWDVRREWKAIAKNGSIVHKEIENYINSGEEPKHVKAVMAKNWLDINYDITFLIAEQMIYNEKLGLAGTLDAVLVEEDHKKVSLLDWKTNKEIRTKGTKRKTNPINEVLPDCNFSHYTLQLSVYAYMLEQEGLEIDKLYLVHLGDYVNVHEIDYRKDLVEKMLKWEKENKK